MSVIRDPAKSRRAELTEEGAGKWRDSEKLCAHGTVAKRLHNGGCEDGERIEGAPVAEESDRQQQDVRRLERLPALAPREPIGLDSRAGRVVECKASRDMSLLFGREEATRLWRAGEEPKQGNAPEAGHSAL